MAFFGRDGSAITTQVDRIQEVFGSYMTVVDFHQSSESVTTEFEIYNKLVRYYSRLHDHPKTEFDFMKDLLKEVSKVPNDHALAKELFQQVRDTKITLETVLKRLNENRKLDECLGSTSAIVKPDSGKSADKKSTKQQHTQILQYKAV